MLRTGAATHLIRTFREARQKSSVLQNIRVYRGYIDVHYETDDFLVRTAKNGSDLLKALELRHEVFIEEWQNRRTYHGLDVDKYDFVADHLIIQDKRRNAMIGTYRLLSSHFTHNFYSSEEFHIGEFLRVPAVKLELGRACVHPEHRNGNTIDLLWKGLTQYIATSKTQYLFGCSSVKTMDGHQIGKLYATLKSQGLWSREFAISTTPEYQFAEFRIDGETLDAQEKRKLFPPLLRSYLHAGAKVYGLPALDLEFECTDLFTILNWSQLNQRFRSRFA